MSFSDNFGIQVLKLNREDVLLISWIPVCLHEQSTHTGHPSPFNTCNLKAQFFMVRKGLGVETERVPRVETERGMLGSL